MRKAGVSGHGRVLLFVSEPLEENYGMTRGYTQYSALRFFLQKILPSQGDVLTLLKLHPKDIGSKYGRIIKSTKQRIEVIGQDFDPLEALAVSDAVFGMTSVMLIQAFILGKPVVSLQPGLIGEDQMVLSRHGYIRKITSVESIACMPPKGVGRHFCVEFNEEKFLSLVRKLVKQ
jgi:hypothetical protein